MIDLDDLEVISKLDSEDVLGAVERFADQCREAWTIGRSAAGLPEADGVDSVLVTGMGGSGISGEVVQAVIEPRLPVPFRTIKSYGPLPEWVGRNTLLFAVSYSGSTEETVEALEEARRRGTRTVAVSSGGPLADLAREGGLAHIAIPSGLQPRASLGYLTLPILGSLSQMGLIPELQEDVDETVEVLADIAGRCHRNVPAAENPAKDLARRINGKVPVIYGSHPLTAVAAQRFKTDLNEYGKTSAFWNYFPELNHNEIVGYNQLADLTSSSFIVVMLRDVGEHERIALRYQITRGLIEDKLADLIEISSEGQSPLARLFSLVLITQLAAIYVGLSYEIDPGPVDVIQSLKAELKKN
ncbi:MAG: bifunctional phosphoglucose/phosphomannose isomerase [Actinobacteria bacterium]|nr:bifunctional phosphoglucose/phosphomannose isomerase [Actinomycetota bacterium]